MNGKQLSEHLHSGKHVYGTLITTPSPRWPAVVSSLGLDFVFIDTEHTAIDRHQLSWMCQTYAALSLAPVVRIPAPDPNQAAMALDGGAQGIIAPYIENPDEILRLVGAVKYRPLKGKKLAQHLSGERPLDANTLSYLAHYNQNNLLIVNIESIPAISDLDSLLAVEGLDAVLIGPHDLTTNMDIPEQWHHPDYVKAVDEVILKSRARGIGAGVHIMYSDALEQWKHWSELGANLIIQWADLSAFRYAMQAAIHQIKCAVGDIGDDPSSQISVHI